jgi:hypothetical protein
LRIGAVNVLYNCWPAFLTRRLGILITIGYLEKSKDHQKNSVLFEHAYHGSG